MARTRGGIWAPVVIGVVGVSVQLALGFWQLQRLEWKQGVIARIEARLAAEPAALPGEPAHGADYLRRVTVTGHLGRREIHVLSSVKRLGPGFRVIAPMQLARDGEPTGRTIMVDLGFVPERMKKLADREPPSVRLTKRLPTDAVTGVLYWPDEVDSFTPEPDLGRNIWFARDVARMAGHLGTEPVLLVAERHPDGDWPRPMPPGVDIPNRHLEYVLTWFGLALVWAAMTLIWLRAEWRKSRRQA